MASGFTIMFSLKLKKKRFIEVLQCGNIYCTVCTLNRAGARSVNEKNFCIESEDCSCDKRHASLFCF